MQYLIHERQKVWHYLEPRPLGSWHIDALLLVGILLSYAREVFAQGRGKWLRKNDAAWLTKKSLLTI